LPEETRIEQVIDRVNTTGAVWLGTTLECAQCHDHKYDPFTMRDYYSILACYNQTQAEAERKNPKQPSSIAFIGPSMPLSDNPKDARRAELQQAVDDVQQQLADRRRELDSSLVPWAGEFAETAGQAPAVHSLLVTSFSSEGTTDTHKVLPDHSVLLVGDDPPDTDNYTVTLHAEQDIPSVSAVRLDVLTDESLPGSGPGRGDAQRTNFVLNRLTAVVQHDDGTEQPVEFSEAQADFSQNNWDVSEVLNGGPKSGWAIAPQFGKPHWAILSLKQPLTLSKSTRLVVRMEQRFGGGRSIGRFRLSVMTGNLNAESLPADLVAAFKTPVTDWSDKQRTAAVDFRTEQDTVSQKRNQSLRKLQKELNALQPETTLVMIENDQPRPNYMFVRGDYRNHGDAVEPGPPAALHAAPEGPFDRLSLARWLADRRNPLVARVTVNRWWAELFGRGLVATVEDFGMKGEPPTHPELLDWLAVHFMDNNWSMKQTLRTVVLSATYRQSSVMTPQHLLQDDQNRLLSRGPVFRMDAEMIRDTVLSAAGLLSLKQFGPPIRPPQPDGTWTKVGGQNYDYQVKPGDEQYRRGIYVVLKRGAPYPSFINFDASARLACTVKRSRTNTPLQALTLLNDPVYVQAATALARRVLTEKPQASAEQRLDYAFLLRTSRQPTQSERNVLIDLLETQRSENRGRNALGETRSEEPSPSTDSDAELAAWAGVASALINLHETITRQ
ncbi:MAG: DUF1553 domain-containing protein, partial [Planctomycetaceae bacterium]|nr:DUF1553 domain-containing protein [Planctomycetaceae bacterium]